MADRLEAFIDVADLSSTTLNSFTRSDFQTMETFLVQLSGGVLPYIDDAGITGGLSTPDSTAFDVGLTLGSDMLPSDSVMYPTLGYPSDAVHTPESLHEDDETPIVPSTHMTNVTINPNDLDDKTYLNGLMSPPEETHEYVPQGLDEPNFNTIYPTMASIVFDTSAPAASSSETIRIMKMPNPTVVTDAYMNYSVTDITQVQCSNPSSRSEAKKIITPTPKRGGFTGLDGKDKKSIASPDISDRTNSKFVSVTKIDDKKGDVDALSSKIAKLNLEDKKSSHERKLDAEMRKKHAALIYALYQKIHKLYIEMEEKEKIAVNKEETRARDFVVVE
ncbi:8788_t:CDS:1 [Paraglomus brasilianum]|uniref:8788_t:CDS:1 n=1 Tax=Paraglomus brasilianum TaxID=144538 RepID=A0A9N9CLF7_9GLOM|nr:8788_t:CDS:1 [Paraglomus brasilianum]